MSGFRPLTIIFLLFAGLLVTVASAKPAGVLLQEGLYAEEIEGDLDAAIRIYEQIIAENKADENTTAQTMYRLGMCHLKKKNEQQAKAVFEGLVAQFPEQKSIIDKVQPLLDEMSNPDPAALMPPDTKIYLEFGSPGRQIETILDMLKGTPFENPLAAIGAGAAADANTTRQKSPADAMAALFNPSMIAEFKKIRGMAIGVTDIRNNNPPMIMVFYPGKSDALRGIFLAMFGMAGKPGETIEGMQTVVIGSQGGVAYDDNTIIISQPPEQLAWCVKQYKGVTQEPTLASQNRLFSRLTRKTREDNALTIWLNGAATYAAVVEQMGKSAQTNQLRMLDAFADFNSIEEVVVNLSVQQSGFAVEANVGFKAGHRSLAYDLIRTPNLTPAAFEAVPVEAIALVSLALGECESSRVDKVRETISKLTGLDIGREIFANIEQITLFVLPPRPASGENVLAKHISPVLPCLGLVVTSHNPQQTRWLLTQLLTATDLAANTSPIGQHPLQQANPGPSKYSIGLVNDQPIYCYIDQVDKATVIALSPEVLNASLSAIKNKQSALTAGPLHQALGNLPPDTSKLALVNVGGAIRSADAHIHRLVDTGRDPNKLLPLSQLLTQLAQACEKTSVRLRTGESINSFNLYFSVSELPPLAGLFPLLMQLPRTMPANLTPNAVKPEPSDGTTVSASISPKLRWVSGINAAAHRVYFGSRSDELSLLAEVTSPDYDRLPTLETNTKYYWRVDEVQADGSVAVGDVWSFTTGRLLGWWKFDETAGNTAADSSGNDNIGTLVGNTRWQPTGGHINGALEFDAKDDYVQIANKSNFDVKGAVTLAAWIKVNPAAKSRWGTIIAKGWVVNLQETTNRIYFSCPGPSGNTEIKGNADVTLEGENNYWHHVVGMYDGTKLCIYVDGKLDASGKVSGNIATNDYNVRIGANEQWPEEAFGGLIDDVRVYNYALGEAEIMELYKGSRAALSEKTNAEKIKQ
jgi:hypothetical protein